MFPKAKGFLLDITYRPPNSSNHLAGNFEEKFNEMLQTVLTEDKECILMG